MSAERLSAFLAGEVEGGPGEGEMVARVEAIDAGGGSRRPTDG